jgi:hypothetical protein
MECIVHLRDHPLGARLEAEKPAYDGAWLRVIVGLEGERRSISIPQRYVLYVETRTAPPRVRSI